MLFSFVSIVWQAFQFGIKAVLITGLLAIHYKFGLHLIHYFLSIYIKCAHKIRKHIKIQTEYLILEHVFGLVCH